MSVPSAPPDCVCSSSSRAPQSRAVPARGRTAAVAAGAFSLTLGSTSWPLINDYNRIHLLRGARTRLCGRRRAVRMRGEGFYEDNI